VGETKGGGGALQQQLSPVWQYLLNTATFSPESASSMPGGRSHFRLQCHPANTLCKSAQRWGSESFKPDKWSEAMLDVAAASRMPWSGAVAATGWRMLGRPSGTSKQQGFPIGASISSLGYLALT